MTGQRPVCDRPRCDEPRYARGLCQRHYTVQRRWRNHRGDGDQIDTPPAVAHVLLLRWRGWSWQQIAPAGGTSYEMLQRLVAGGQPTMRRDKVARIRGIAPVWQRTTVSVPVVGTRRRLSALAWQGWSNAAVARQIGMSESTIPNSSRSGRITAVVAAGIADFFDEHAHRPGPDPMYAKKARTLGALPASVWDEDGSIDDPQARPHGARGGAQVIAPAGPRWSTAEVVDVAEDLLWAGRTPQEIAVELGMSVTTLTYHLSKSEERAS